MSRSILEILLKITGGKASKELKQVDKDLGKIEKTAKDSGKGIKGFNTDLIKLGATIGGVTAGVVAAGKALWELGKRGAIVEQTEQSFEGLLDQLEVAPDLLEDLRKASRGTVDDMTLMSSVLTLVAGSGEDLSREMLNASPRLLEIAKAANKLNPALGSTSLLFDSITAGIKRNSKMVLDNLGIVFSQTSAYEEYAQSIGKSVDALSDEEKALATLSKVAGEAGENLLRQVGGNIDAVGDSMAEMETNTKNLSNELAKLASHGVNPVAESMADLTTNANEGLDNIISWHRAVREGKVTRDEFLDWFSLYISGQATASDFTEILNQKTEEATQKWENLTRVWEETASWVSRMGGSYAYVADVTEDISISAEDAAKAEEEFARRLEDVNQASRDAITNLRELMDTRIEDYFDVDLNIGDIAARMFDITQFKELGGEALSIMVREVQEGLVQGKITPEQAREFFKNISVEAEAIKVQMGEISAEEAAESIADDFNVSVEEAQGLIDGVLSGIDLINSADISAITSEFDALEERRQKLMEAGEIPIEADPQDEAKQALEDLQGKIDYMTAHPWIITFDIVTRGTVPGVGTTTTDTDAQTGADFVVPPGFPHDTYTVGVTSGERVTVTRPGQYQGAMNYTQIVNQHFYNEGAAALALAVVRHSGRGRLNSSMGR